MSPLRVITPSYPRFESLRALYFFRNRDYEGFLFSLHSLYNPKYLIEADYKRMCKFVQHRDLAQIRHVITLTSRWPMKSSFTQYDTGSCTWRSRKWLSKPRKVGKVGTCTRRTLSTHTKRSYVVWLYAGVQECIRKLSR